MRYLCIVQYDGTNYGGWQIQPNNISIQETIETKLSKILNCETKIYGSGRTDAGVHALGQTFHFDANKKISDLGKFKYSLNSLLPNDIFVKEIKVVSDDFNARLLAKDKTYKYLVNTGIFNVFERNFSFQYLQKIDITKMQECSKIFIGEHCFQNFTSKETDERNFIRKINRIDITTLQDKIVFTLNGNGFMRYMVRMIVGTLIQVGIGKINIDEVMGILNMEKRKIISYKAPANGLYLVEVNYKD